MKQLLIASGKGGTGKTSLCSAFASLTSKALLADCDVDASDLHLILTPKINDQEVFISGKEAKISPSLCNYCGKCKNFCRFDAISPSISEHCYIIDPISCDGCSLCSLVCPENAIKMEEKECGLWFSSSTRFGTMIHAQLHPGGENSGKLVHKVRQTAIAKAKENQLDLILIDGPPGTGCPVIASITGCNATVIVVEPTLSSQHDAQRMIHLANHFNVKPFLIINKWDISPDISNQIIKEAEQHNIEILGKISYDMDFIYALLEKKSIIEFNPKSKSSEHITEIWKKTERYLHDL